MATSEGAPFHRKIQLENNSSTGKKADDPIWNYIAVIGPGLLIATLYAPTLVELVRIWNVDPNYSHGFVVPVISLIMAIAAWHRCGSPIAARVVDGVVLGMCEVAGGLVLHTFAWLVGNLFFDVIGLILILRGTLLIQGGRAAIRSFGFATFFLIFMAPLPIGWYQPIALVMQQIVSEISFVFLQLIEIPAYREGSLIHLPGYAMEVGEACSGIRQLIAVLAISVAIGYFTQRGKAYTWALTLLSVPISIAANSLRIMLTGVIMILFGEKWAEGIYHTLEGLVIVGLAAALVCLTAWFLAKAQNRLTGKTSAGPAEAAP